MGKAPRHRHAFEASPSSRLHPSPRPAGSLVAGRPRLQVDALQIVNRSALTMQPGRSGRVGRGGFEIFAGAAQARPSTLQQDRGYGCSNQSIKKLWRSAVRSWCWSASAAASAPGSCRASSPSLENQARSELMLENHMDADMMHDALQGGRARGSGRWRSQIRRFHRRSPQGSRRSRKAVP